MLVEMPRNKSILDQFQIMISRRGIDSEEAGGVGGTDNGPVQMQGRFGGSCGHLQYSRRNQGLHLNCKFG